MRDRIRKRKDLTGKRYGRMRALKCIKENPKLSKPRKGNPMHRRPGFKDRQEITVDYIYACRCDCGTEVEIPGWKLRNQMIESCGCLRKEKQLLKIKMRDKMKQEKDEKDRKKEMRKRAEDRRSKV